jgi:hypothetical protein
MPHPSKSDSRPDKRCWLVHSETGEQKIFTGSAIAAAKKGNWITKDAAAKADADAAAKATAAAKQAEK